ncbi:MAG TPA: polymer-forming cytoskeletal protein [Byssovorax sp.]|jgi:cytoskeletal protein CcmA (bactofilin family)
MARGPAPTRGSTGKPEHARADADESVLARGTRVRGHVRGAGHLSVRGSVEGDVAIDGDLTIEDGGGVTGDVNAASVTIRGALTGDVAARGAVAILAGANVTGNMGGAEVSLEEGAAFTGRIEAEFDLPPELTSKGR